MASACFSWWQFPCFNTPDSNNQLIIKPDNKPGVLKWGNAVIHAVQDTTVNGLAQTQALGPDDTRGFILKSYKSYRDWQMYFMSLTLSSERVASTVALYSCGLRGHLKKTSMCRNIWKRSLKFGAKIQNIRQLGQKQQGCLKRKIPKLTGCFLRFFLQALRWGELKPTSSSTELRDNWWNYYLLLQVSWSLIVG